MIDTFLTEIGSLVSADWWREHALAVFNVIAIDVVLAGDNAIVVGLAASRVARDKRAKVIFWGIAAAVLMRIGFAAITQQLLAIVGLTLLGGFLLLWVCWKMYRQISGSDSHEDALAGGDAVNNHEMGFWAAVTQIAIADVSMSLDNVIAVAGAAGESVLVLVIGLVVAIALMAVASHFIAQLLVRYPWITWIGLIIILYVALDMVVRGAPEILYWLQGVDCQVPGAECPKLSPLGWLKYWLGLA